MKEAILDNGTRNTENIWMIDEVWDRNSYQEGGHSYKHKPGDEKHGLKVFRRSRRTRRETAKKVNEV